MTKLHKTKLLLTLLLTTNILAGCSEEENRPGTGVEVACFNTAATVNYTRESWAVTENLQRTQGDDILKSMQPDSSANDASETAIVLKNYLQSQMKVVLGLEGEPESATSYLNSLDLIEEVIAKDEVFNVISGRQMVSGCAQSNVAIRYNNKDFTLNHAGGGLPLSYLVDYNYSNGADIDGNKYITRTLWEFSQSNETTDEAPESATVLASNSALSLTTYRADLFTNEGYMTPSSVIASWSDASGSDISIYKDYDTYFKDTAEHVDSRGFTPSESLGTLKRIKIRVSYQTGVADVFISDFVSAYSVVDKQDNVTDIILKDVTGEELNQLFKDNPEWKAVVPYKDPGYDGDNATPLTSYTGTLLPHRG